MYLKNNLLSVFFVLGFDISVSFSTTQFDYQLSIPNPECGVFQNQELCEHPHAMKAHEALFHARYYSNVLHHPQVMCKRCIGNMMTSSK